MMRELAGGETAVQDIEHESILVSVRLKVEAPGKFIAHIVIGFDIAPSPIAVTEDTLIE